MTYLSLKKQLFKEQKKPDELTAMGLGIFGFDR